MSVATGKPSSGTTISVFAADVERTLYFLFYIVYRGIRKDGLIVL
jgi:hypothetical protein